MIYVIATVFVRPETIPAFMTGARDVIAATNKEDGCLFYDLNQSVTNPDTFVFVERWASREALGEHFKTPHIKVWREIWGACVSKPAVVEIVTAAGVETL